MADTFSLLPRSPPEAPFPPDSCLPSCLWCGRPTWHAAIVGRSWSRRKHGLGRRIGCMGSSAISWPDLGGTNGRGVRPLPGSSCVGLEKCLADNILVIGSLTTEFFFYRVWFSSNNHEGEKPTVDIAGLTGSYS